MDTLTIVPPKYDATQWSDTDCVAPALYKGFPDAFRFFAELVTAREEWSLVAILGKPVKACNLQMETPDRDPNYPVYFELTGQHYHYVFNVWENRVVIEVCDPEEYALLSVMFPSTKEELTRALSTIVDDLF